MKKLALVLISALLLGGCTPKDLFVKPPAGLEIATNPKSTVFLNGTSVGETPYSNKALKPGTYSLKLVPVDGGDLLPYETNLILISKASTVISRTLTASELDASGYTLQLQEDLSGETYLSVISDPDTINVTLDDKPSGFTPISKLGISAGSHSLSVTSPGYHPQSLSVNTVKGYNLIVNFKLASETITLTPQPSATASASPSPSGSPLSSTKPSSSPKSTSSPAPTSVSDMAKPYVVIEETGTGWLRVRKEASGSSEELGKADVGEKLKYLGESTELGWHKVEFEGGVGWVSGKYVTVVK